MKKRSLKESPELESGKDREILGKKQLFPRIYQIITEKAFIVSLISTIILVAIVVVGLDLYKNFKAKQEIEQKREKIALEIKYWQGIANNYKGYRDAYFKLATLEHQLNNKTEASRYLQKVFELDPNFEAGRKFEKLLEKQN